MVQLWEFLWGILCTAETPGGDLWLKVKLYATGLVAREVSGQRSRVRLWRGRGRRCRGADSSVLVACTITAVRRQGVGVQGFVLSRSQVGFVRRHRRRCVSGLGAEDEPGLVLLLQVGRVLHHGFTVGYGQLVGAVGNEVEAAGNEDDGQRKHGDYDKSKAHGQRPGRVALEAFLSLQTQREGLFFYQKRNHRKTIA